MIDGRITQGSTPNLSFDLPISEELIKEIRVSFSQKNKLILVKEAKDCRISSTILQNENGEQQEVYTLNIPLTQEDTYLFKESMGLVSIRLRILAVSGGVAVADEIMMRVEEIADKAVMGNAENSDQI